ncbi:MAG: sigma-54 dependent transcriptional regulator, partial [Myxococcales bacterium]|nr:sigma-54 dependent transcriptional regulator [Myxococcales bacterium]
MACAVATQTPAAALVGRSLAMKSAKRMLVRAAAVDSSVLLLGETGTGKGVAARVLHEGSARRHGPFVQVDCAALAPSVFESEVFGHERGSFTGAVARHQGRFERAAGGTLFLDEVGELSLPFQAKLLTALQDRRFERLGGDRAVALDARVVAATNRNLVEDVAAGRFRLDLYHRLHVLEIELPPLRARPEDIPELVQAHLPELSSRAGIAPPELTPDFVAVLAARPWPGNVRELLHELERSLVLCGESVLDASSLMPAAEISTRPAENALAPGSGGLPTR